MTAPNPPIHHLAPFRDSVRGSRRGPLRRGTWSVVLTLASLWLVPHSTAVAHDPPDIFFEYDLTAERLQSKVMIKDDLYRHWIRDHRASQFLDMSDAEFDRAKKVIRDFFDEYGPVEIDRVHVTPIVVSADFQESFAANDRIDYIEIILEYGTKGLPRQVQISWNRFDTANPSWPLPLVSASFEYDTTNKFYNFYPGEPGGVWHTPQLPRRNIERSTVPPPPSRWRIPIPTLSVLALVALASVFYFARNVGRTWAWGSIAAGLIAAVACAPYGVREIAPWWHASAPPPSVDEAREIFEALHRNVYRAFDYDTEDEIYDALARSVDDRLLDSVYNEVYQSLVVQEEGGAMSKVRGVEIVDADVQLKDPSEGGDEPVTFSVECRWRVTGTVVHWGHSHWRTNEYQARYTLRRDADRWRIVDVDLESQKRIEGGDGAPSNPDTAPAAKDTAPAAKDTAPAAKDTAPPKKDTDEPL
ncbi:MAG: hypothetical protein KDC38_11915 [Planctomycetes bacterium]|nr:hypothetical protein [Planctomycetota bacterium]